jgi:hypothetical protein
VGSFVKTRFGLEFSTSQTDGLRQQHHPLESLPRLALFGLAPVVVVGGRAAADDPDAITRLGAHYLGNDPGGLVEKLMLLMQEAGLR